MSGRPWLGCRLSQEQPCLLVFDFTPTHYCCRVKLVTLPCLGVEEGQRWGLDDDTGQGGPWGAHPLEAQRDWLAELMSSRHGPVFAGLQQGSRIATGALGADGPALLCISLCPEPTDSRHTTYKERNIYADTSMRHDITTSCTIE